MSFEESYRSWKEFEELERRRVATFQLSIDVLERDLYMDSSIAADEETVELDFD